MVNGNESVENFLAFWNGKDYTGKKEAKLAQAYENAFKKAELAHSEILKHLDFERTGEEIKPVFKSTVNGLVDDYEGYKRQFEGVEDDIKLFFKMTNNDNSVANLINETHRLQNQVDTLTHQKNVLLIHAIKGTESSESVAQVVLRNDEQIAKLQPQVAEKRDLLQQINSILDKYN